MTWRELFLFHKHDYGSKLNAKWKRFRKKSGLEATVMCLNKHDHRPNTMAMGLSTHLAVIVK